MIITSATRAKSWRGASGGSGETTLVYGGDGVETLPKRLRPNKKGKQELEFDSIEEAEAVAAELTKYFVKANPKARPPPQYPGYTFFYIGDERIWGYEFMNKTDLSLALAATKKGAATKAGHLFFPVEPGAVKFELHAGKFTLTADGGDAKRKTKKLKALEHDGGDVLIFPAALTTKQLSMTLDWAVHVPDQVAPGGARVAVSAKKITAAVSEGFLEVSW